MFTISWTEIKHALVLGVVVGVLAMIAYVLNIGDIFAVNAHALINSGVIALLASVSQVITSLLTTRRGNFMGVVRVK